MSLELTVDTTNGWETVISVAQGVSIMTRNNQRYLAPKTLRWVVIDHQIHLAPLGDPSRTAPVSDRDLQVYLTPSYVLAPSVGHP